MTRSRATFGDNRGGHRLAGLCVLAMLWASCGGAPAREPAGGSGGDGGNGGEGGSGGSSAGGTGGSRATGGSGGTAGSGGSGEATGGSGGSSSGGSSGYDAAMTTGLADAGATTPDASSGSASDSGGGGSSDNPCYNPKAIKNRTLPNLSVKDFCDAYEKYCMYTPDGSMMSKCGPGQPVGPLYRDRMDCETKYGAASPSAKACRAGQMCVNAPAGLIVNACSHATGYCAGACK
jgi:hypothetical protein